MKIEKKVWPEYFQKILEGKKTFDFRLADFEVKEGDILVLKEFNPETRSYTGRVLEKKITYIAKTKDSKFYKQEDVDKHGFIIMGLE